jgi:hypothetical protein
VAERCTRVVGCVRCAKPCALVGDLIPADGLCPWCRQEDAPAVTALAVRDGAFPTAHLTAQIRAASVAIELLSQVALEGIRLVHAPLKGGESCSECGLGGDGALRDALKAALGPGYTALVWGNAMNIDMDAWAKALRKQAEVKGG